MRTSEDKATRGTIPRAASKSFAGDSREAAAWCQKANGQLMMPTLK